MRLLFVVCLKEICLENIDVVNISLFIFPYLLNSINYISYCNNNPEIKKIYIIL